MCRRNVPTGGDLKNKGLIIHLPEIGNRGIFITSKEAKTNNKKTRMNNQRVIKKRTTTTDEAVGEIKEIAKEYYTAKVAKNAASRVEMKARKDLYTAMKKVGIRVLPFIAMVGGKRVNLEAKVSAPKRVTVDVDELNKLVEKGVITRSAFLQMISATQKSVRDIEGEAILRQVARDSDGTENVSVDPLK